jgi:hypothetical protein
MSDNQTKTGRAAHGRIPTRRRRVLGVAALGAGALLLAARGGAAWA